MSTVADIVDRESNSGYFQKTCFTERDNILVEILLNLNIQIFDVPKCKFIFKKWKIKCWLCFRLVTNAKIIFLYNFEALLNTLKW